LQIARSGNWSRLSGAGCCDAQYADFRWTSDLIGIASSFEAIFLILLEQKQPFFTLDCIQTRPSMIKKLNFVQ
jgi:hypothetical protein